MKIRPIALLAAIAVLGFASSSVAQTSNYYSGTQTNGLFGQNTLGGTSSTNSGQSLGSPGGSGNVGNTSSNIATTGQANVAVGNQNVAQAAIENTRQQTQGSFIGADSADTGNFLSRQNTAGAAGATGRGGINGMNGLAQLQNLFSKNQQNFNGQNQAQTMPQIRVSLRLGFRPQPLSTTRMQSFQTRLTKLPAMRFVGSPEVLMEGRTAVLRGKVASEDDRELAEALAKMEPDVLEVRNELVVVDSQDASAETLPQGPVTPRPVTPRPVTPRPVTPRSPSDLD
jgi:hypothetical protein